MRIADKTLGAVGGPLDRLVQLAGGPGDDRLLGIVIDLAAEAAADIRRHHAQFVLGQAKDKSAHQQPDHVRVLACRVQRVVAGRWIEIADRGARLHRVRDQPVVLQLQLHDFRGGGECRIERGLVAEMPVVADVAGDAVVYQRRAGRGRRGHGRDRGQVFEFDRQQFGRVARLLLGFGDHHRDRVADMAHLAVRKHGVLGLGHRAAVLVVDLPTARQPADRDEVGAGVHRDHAGRGFCGRRIDGNDFRVRPVAALDHRVQLAGAVDVVDVVAVPGGEAQVFLAPDRCADAFERCVHCAPPLPRGAGRAPPRACSCARAVIRRRSPSPCRASAAMRRRSP